MPTNTYLTPNMYQNNIEILGGNHYITFNCIQISLFSNLYHSSIAMLNSSSPILFFYKGIRQFQVLLKY
jgi:hypothetical protein